MLYVQQSLGPGEEIIKIGKFHWMYNVSAVMAIVWGIIWGILIIVGAYFAYPLFVKGGLAGDNLMEQLQNMHVGVRIAAFLSFVFGLMKFARMMVIKATTEIAVTNKRIIYKRGLVARYVGEISIDRVEGVNVLQGIMGRIFNYGRLIVRGMGIGEVILPPIADPLSFRKAIDQGRMV